MELNTKRSQTMTIENHSEHQSFSHEDHHTIHHGGLESSHAEAAWVVTAPKTIVDLWREKGEEWVEEDLKARLWEKWVASGWDQAEFPSWFDMFWNSGFGYWAGDDRAVWAREELKSYLWSKESWKAADWNWDEYDAWLQWIWSKGFVSWAW